MATQSRLPVGQNLSPELMAYLQRIEGRVPSNTTPLDPAATNAQIVAAFNQLVQDLKG